MERLLLPLVLSVGSWLISWFVMWVLHEAAAKNKFYIEDVIHNMGDVITEDGNDLFKTGLMYSVLLLISLLCPWKWVEWVLFALTIARCIPPIGGFYRTNPASGVEVSSRSSKGISCSLRIRSACNLCSDLAVRLLMKGGKL